MRYEIMPINPFPLNQNMTYTYEMAADLNQKLTQLINANISHRSAEANRRRLIL